MAKAFHTGKKPKNRGQKRARPRAGAKKSAKAYFASGSTRGQMSHTGQLY